MSEDKPRDYQHRLSSNLHQLYHNEVGINNNASCDIVTTDHCLQSEYPSEVMGMQHQHQGSGQMYRTGMMNQIYRYKTCSGLDRLVCLTHSTCETATNIVTAPMKSQDLAQRIQTMASSHGFQFDFPSSLITRQFRS